ILRFAQLEEKYRRPEILSEPPLPLAMRGSRKAAWSKLWQRRRKRSTAERKTCLSKTSSEPARARQKPQKIPLKMSTEKFRAPSLKRKEWTRNFSTEYLIPSVIRRACVRHPPRLSPS